jgi:hypothetical protein
VSYSHTQTAPLHYILHAVGAGTLVGAWLSRDEWLIATSLGALAALMFLFGFMFGHLTVRDETEFLAIRYGPIQVFYHRIPFADISSAEPCRSSIIDGWGIHWTPGRGLIYNLWGFGCVKLAVNGKTVRIGTDDVDNLVTFLRGRIVEGTAAP